MTKLVRYSPFGVRSPFGIDWNRFFDEFSPMQAEDDTGSPTVWRPRVDISESESNFMIAVDLPGISKDDVNINFENDMLTVSGERKESDTREDANYYRTERIYGRFARTFTFPKSVDVDNISAEFKDGVLHVTVPKTAESKPRRIQIR